MVEPIFMKNDDFLKVPKLRTSTQRIVLNHSRLWKPSRKLVRTFLTPKIYDLELQTKCSTSRSTAGPEFISDMKSTYLELQEPAQDLSPDDFSSIPKIEKTRSLPLFLYIQKFVKRMFENLFLRYFGRRIRF